jgi:2,3-diketo-5-methylthiopentyl-1-phosphate enolase
MVYAQYPYGRTECLDGDYLIATYLMFGTDCGSALKKSGGFAVGQTVGTWISVPGVSSSMVENYQGRVVSLYPVACAEETVFVLRVAFPMVNFADSFTIMMTALVGNDVSTALQTKLIDIELCGNASRSFKGPKKGIDDLRKITGAYDRPVVLNMIKPCTGFTPEEGAKLFYASACGGIDLIKDDELLGSPSYNQVAERVKAYLKASESAFEQTGKRTVYMPNISGSPKKMRDNAKAVVQAGAKACLVNFVFGGLDTLAEICEEFGNDLFIMGHYAGVGVMNWARGGIANPVFLGIIPRLAGAHAVMTMCPNRQDSTAMLDFYQTVQAQNLPMKGIRPLVTAVGGGITPINQEELQKELGNDVILGIGGAVQGHPMGTTEGAKTAMCAVEAAAKGISLETAAKTSEGLRTAIQYWNK